MNDDLEACFDPAWRSGFFAGVKHAISLNRRMAQFARRDGYESGGKCLEATANALEKSLASIVADIAKVTS